MHDILLIDELLNDDERILQNSVHDWVQAKVVPHLAKAFEDASFPEHFIEGVAKLGLLGMTLPAKLGGSDASGVMYGIACQELERGDSGLRSFVSVQSSLCMYPIFAFGNEQQHQRFLPAMARANCIGCFGLTEPDAGSDPSSMRTVAKKVDGGYLLNGSKMWITNAPVADIAIVWAKTDEGIRGFIVEKEFKGFDRREIKLKMSLRASITGELAFNDVFVPEQNLLPGSDIGLAAPLKCLTQARYGIAWGVVGAAMSCFDTVVAYTKERKQFNTPVAKFQLVQKDLADMLCEITKARLINLRLGRLKDNNQLTPEMVSLAKMNNCRQALAIARKARNLLGGNGISLEYPVIRHMMNLESVFTYEGTDNIHTLVLGKYITGLNAFA